ncbi:histone deacetylase family protein [Balneatrix alpica]|uniref:histone deacetylase family protein n=1 Tax=Balneatrix alpica TaxID=75684 RepID=UPI002739A376|nr:histone deacetylase [Balneatrix alpica]
MKQDASLPLVYHPIYSIPFPAQHRFPMAKFQLLYQQLCQQGIATTQNCFSPSAPAPLSILQLAHCPQYIQQFCQGELDAKALREIGLPWSPLLVQRTCTAVAGTILTAELAKRYGLACHLAGGTHHAFYRHGAGFCIFNDLAVCARYLVQNGLAKQVLIIDCDVHQGDGTAAILQQDANIHTCSFHSALNYPFTKMHSDWDIEIEDDCGDSDYLSILQQHLPSILACLQPDFILYDAGSDVHQDDRLGRLKLTDQGIRQRDNYIIQLAHQHNIAIACVIGGGYDRDHAEVARRHSLLHQQANLLFNQLYR